MERGGRKKERKKDWLHMCYAMWRERSEDIDNEKICNMERDKQRLTTCDM